jgi:hypothetical protein
VLGLPPAAVVLAAAPEPSVQSPQRLLWRWMLPAGAAQPFALVLRAPEAAGAYALLATLNSIRNGETRLYGSYPLTLTVADAGETGPAVLSELQALAPASMRERQDRDRAAQQIEERCSAGSAASEGDTDRAAHAPKSPASPPTPLNPSGKTRGEGPGMS